MGFSKTVVDRAMSSCERCCCICHKFCGTKMELHHIKPKCEGGKDTFENCIPLCFDCHSDMGSLDVRHPKGRHYSQNELRLHRDRWYQKCSIGYWNDNASTVPESDKILFRTICSFFDEEICYELQNSDFRRMIPSNIFETLDRFSCFFLSPLQEFLNPEMEKARCTLIASVDDLTSLIAGNTFVEMVSGKRFSVTQLYLFEKGDIPHHAINKKELAEMVETYDEIASRLSRSASNMWDTFCRFVRQCRSIIGE